MISTSIGKMLRRGEKWSERLLALKIFIIPVVLGLAFLLERKFPVSALRHTRGGLLRNLGLAFVNFLLGPVIVLPITIWASGHGLSLRPLWWNVVLDLLILDLWIYWWHRLNHVLPILWRFHVVHHLDEALDSTSALRFHFGEVALSALVRGGLIWLWGIPLASVAVFESMVAVGAIFHHSNVQLPERLENALTKLIVTPKLHWVHHHAVRHDTDSNYATVLSIWDVLFQSRSKTLRKREMKIGVEGQGDQPLLALLRRPFGI